VPLSDSTSSDRGMPVDELVTGVKSAIKRANVSATDPDRDLQVSSVQLTLHTVATAKAGGGLEFCVPFVGMKVKFGGSVTHQTTHTMEITLVPEPTAPAIETRDLAVDDILVDAIGTIRSVIAHAAEGDDPFTMQDSNVKLSFGVTEDGSISLGVESELQDEITHTMRLTLSRPKAGKGA
jgi:hypothetical protein